MRVLYIQASWVPPSEELQADRFFLLSEYLEGDVLQPVWFQEPGEVEAAFGPGTYPTYTRGRFHYHWFLSSPQNGLRQRLGKLWFCIRKGLELHRRNPYQCIVVYSHMTPALAALVLKLLTGAKLVVEIMTAPELSYLYEHPKRTIWDRVMRLLSDLSLHVSVRFCDRVHLLYETQLDHYPLLRRVPRSVFHDFVPVSLIQPVNGDHERTVLMVGAPWYLKGADVLIEAWQKVAEEFPDITLKIQGYNPDHDALEALAAGSPQIEIVKAAPNAETIRRISRALVVVLASRCEGLSRVLIEAMSAAVPVIGSDVGGTPHCIRQGENGFVFPSVDVDELRSHLRVLLADGDMRKRMGSKGYELAHTQLSERVYTSEFTRMVEATVQGGQ